jgi:uncharacterized hydrophobic protein (TIGR00341 family)
MALRLIRVVVPESEGSALAELLGRDEAADRVALLRAEDGPMVAEVLVPVEEAEALMDRLEDRFGGHEGFRLVVLQTQAVLPRQEETEGPEEAGAGEEPEEEEPAPDRISREELYAEVTDGLRASPTFLAMAGLSAVVAAVGLLRNDLAVVIGAMVIAPLLRPNVALALATTLADHELAWKATLTNAAGSGLALVLAVAIGLAVRVDPSIPALASRSAIDYQGLVLALAAGAAGSLAFTRGLAGAVIGVMVAVALLPPLVAAGLLLGAGHFPEAGGAFLLTAGNLICINLAGVVTFLVQGIRPHSWWEAERAKKAALGAAAVWLALLLVLAGLLAIGGELGGIPSRWFHLP